MTAAQDPLGAYRGRLLGLAYRMLGSRADAEDVLQDAYMRYARADRADVDNIEAYLVTTVTRLCLDQLKSARAKREVYVGPWLPEPVLDTESLSPHRALEIADDLSFALLLTLERLSAPERAAFLLHDVFDAPFTVIAAALGRSEEACRQLAARARKAVRAHRPPRVVTREAHDALLKKFADAAKSGDASRLQALLAADAMALTDGGGKKTAALNPVYGADKIARFITGIMRKNAAGGRKVALVHARINGEAGVLIFIDGALDSTLSLDSDGERITAVYLVRNPDKLRMLNN